MNNPTKILYCIVIAVLLCVTSKVYAETGEILATGTEHCQSWWGCTDIPDNGGWVGRVYRNCDLQDAPDSAVITHVIVKYDINHTWVSDLIVVLTTERNGIWYDDTLWNREGGNSVDIHETDTIWTRYDGLDPNGTWYLMAWDNAVEDVGCIDDFEIWVFWYKPDPLPDLIVDDIWITPTNPCAGDQVTITTRLCNIGIGDADPFYLNYYLDGAYIGNDYLTFGLNAGNCNNETIPYTVPVSSPGDHTVQVCVDPANDITESNENNNCREEIFNWIACGPDIDIQPSSLTINEEGCQRISAIVGDGTSISRASPLEFYSPLSVGNGAYLHFNKQVFDEFKNSSYVTLKDFVLEEGRLIDLELQQFTIFDNRTVFVEGTPTGDITLPAPDVTLFHGIVKGYPGSNVYLGLSDLAVNGFIEIDGQKFILSGDRKSGERISEQVLTIFDYESVPFANVEPWLCGGGVEVALNELIPPENRAVLGPTICYVAVDGDYEYYQTMGSSTSAALDYMVVLLGATTLFYQRDFDATLWLNYSRVWSTSNDPYTETGADDTELVEFKDYWNENMGHVVRNLAHKFAGTSGGGIAYLNVLCNQSMAYGISHVNGSFPFPIESGPGTWDLVVVSHEIGHNFGTTHTHCYSPPIDQCYSSDEGCYNGFVNCSRGTIMSYCHLCGGGVSNIDLNFHTRVIDYILPIVQSASCLNTASASFTVNNVGTEVLEVYDISSFDGWLMAWPIVFSVEAGGSRQVDMSVDWSQLSTTIQGQLDIQSNDPDESMSQLPVTAVPCPSCCVGITGNVDGSGDDQIDIADIVYFIDYAFSLPPGPAPPCLDEADVNSDSIIDIGDIVYLIDYSFSLPPGPIPVDCL